MNPITHIFVILADGEARRYGCETVTQQAHALQCANLAERAGAPATLIAAALLHDIGHLINPDDRPAFERNEDGRHEIVADAFLSQWFHDAVVQPVRWHVDAKRYLTAVETGYHDGLSELSKQTLALQGGPYTDEEARNFEARPYAHAAVALRRWDDGAKVPGAMTPPLPHFRPYLEESLKVRVSV